MSPCHLVGAHSCWESVHIEDGAFFHAHHLINRIDRFLRVHWLNILGTVQK